MTESSSKVVKTITKKDLNSFVDALIKDKTHETVGVKAKGKRFVFGPLEHSRELRLDYDVTILPPKKYFLPQYEKLMDFTLGEPLNVQQPNTEKPLILIGVHPYDIIALGQTDKLYLDSQKDDFYKKRREQAIIIGVDMQQVSERSFAASMNTHVTDSGFDLLLTNIGDKYTITIGSEKGENLLEKYAKTKVATAAEIEKRDEIQKNLASKFKKSLKVPKEEWSGLLVANYNHPIWEKRSQKCMECSSCTMVCPTCFCYDVKDDVSLNLKNGSRIRTWDGCLLRDFTLIGSGEVFREDISKRYRHRFYRKGNYLPERYGFIACVGCGRCGIACLPDIADPCDVINDLSHFERSDNTGKFFIKQKTEEVADKGLIHIPRSATIKRMEKLTESEMFFEIELDDKKSLGHKPGQFVEVSIFGIGEAPISVSSGPSASASFELVVRRVGNVTSHLFKMKPGEKLGIRGPLGNGFDVKSFEKKHLLLSAAGLGIAPMRSLIQYVLDKKNRKKFKDIMILYGAKEPNLVLFKEEIDEWCKIVDVTCELTVDQCAEGECWTGCTGLITTLYPKIHLDKYDSENTIAVIIGPPIAYRYIIKCLQTLGIMDRNIYVSLERRMKCGVGKCGHCQINGVYVCKEGPVFNYEQIKNLPEAFE
ncbi:MAG: 4Fe-4S dicluster domain-containing protein [Candidatus Thermoplasmatota archaeon]|nr:4Fe-4S dicluster domain-containing protein [Candidatus Thermoplasmatota archaeon]